MVGTLGWGNQKIPLTPALSPRGEGDDNKREIMNKQSIGFFDSGVGGLTVFEKVKKILPTENYLYFGDLKNIPYGEKSKEELIKIAEGIFEFFENKGVKAVVMACNTTSANVYEELKDNYSFKIYPIIQSCASVIAKLPIEKIGVFATEATIKSGVYARELKKHNPNLEVFEMSCPAWVRIVEEKLQDMPESVDAVKSALQEMLKNNPDKIILGCTHYPYLLDVLSKFAPREMFIDPSQYFADFIKADLYSNNLLSDSETGIEQFFVSANPESFKEASSMFYPVNNLPTLVK